MTKTLVTFDIDGTLMFCGHRGAHHRMAFSGAMKDLFNIEADLSEYLGVSFAGVSDLWIIKQIMEKATNGHDPKIEEDLLRIAEEHFLAEFDDELDLLPGVKEAVKALVDAGVDVGVCSGNLPRIGIRKLQAAGLQALVDSKAQGFGTFLDRADILRDAIAKGEAANGAKYQRVIHVGDAPQDVQAALDVGVVAFAVETGRFKHKEQFGDSCTVVTDLKEGLQTLLDLATN